jgi:hypothetical protein
MKNILSLFICLVVMQLASAKSLSVDPLDGLQLSIKNNLQASTLVNYDACTDQYNQQSQLNEWMFGYMVYQCYEVLQFPYSTQCHSEAVLNWSSAQDVIFEQFVYCQNGNAGKAKATK